MNTFLDDFVLQHARTRPEAGAIIASGRRITYAELERQVSALAARLHSAGVGPGHFVAVLLPPSPEIVVAALSVWRVGAVYVPLDPDYPDAQLRDRADQLTPLAVLTEPDALPRFRALCDRILAARGAAESDAPSPSHETNVARSLDDDACVFFTSGSTGRPKAVVGNYRAVRESVLDPSRQLGFTHEDTVNSIARYSWSISMLELFAALVAGGSVLMLDRMQALDLDWLGDAAARCTAFHCPPALLGELVGHVEAGRLSSSRFDAVRLVWYGGDTVAPATIAGAQRIFRHAKIATAYGCTEIFGLSHCHFYSRQEPIAEILLGRPVPSVGEHLEPSATDATAFEVWLSGERVTSGYKNRPDLNAERFVERDRKRFFKTGDLVRRTPSGDISFLGREDDQVKIRGIRVELGEIEAQLNRVPMVRQGVVLAKTRSAAVKELHGYFVPVPGAVEPARQARQWLKQELPDYLVPARLHVLDELPMTANFKIDRARLLALEDVEQTGELDPDSVLGRLAAAWREAGADVGDPEEDSFFDLGGDSLSAAKLASLLTREFGVTVEVADVYSAPTLARQGEVLSGRQQKRLVGFERSRAAEAQRGLFFRELLERRRGSITCSRYILREPGFDPGIVSASLAQLVERFPTLRTTLKPEQGDLWLQTLSPSEVAAPMLLTKEGLWSLQRSERAAPVQKHALHFDLGRGPLLGAVLTPLVEGGQLLQLTAHHTACDDNSMGRLAQDFIELYDASVHGRTPDLPQVEDEYSAYCSTQRERIESHAFDASAAERAGQLLRHMTEHPPLLEPTEQGSGNTASSSHRLDSSNSPRFSDVVAALSWAMAEVFERDAFVFCAHVALRRNEPETPRVGMFVNLVPIPCRVDRSDARRHALGTARSLRQAMAGSDIPYEVIMRQHPNLRKLGGFPFDAFVNELRFDNAYPSGYRDVFVRRSFATDAREISMSLLRSATGDEIFIEGPGTSEMDRVLPQLGERCVDFLSRQR